MMVFPSTRTFFIFSVRPKGPIDIERVRVLNVFSSLERKYSCQHRRMYLPSGLTGRGPQDETSNRDLSAEVVGGEYVDHSDEGQGTVDEETQ